MKSNLSSLFANIQYERLIEKNFPNEKDRTHKKIYALISKTLRNDERGKNIFKKMESGIPLTSHEIDTFRSIIFKE